MGANVTADFQLGGKSNLSRQDLNKIIQVLNISDPQGRLPIGRQARYVLVLETQAPIPTTTTSSKKKKKKKKKKS
jgi:hypothetical protein